MYQPQARNPRHFAGFGLFSRCVAPQQSHFSHFGGSMPGQRPSAPPLLGRRTPAREEPSASILLPSESSPPERERGARDSGGEVQALRDRGQDRGLHLAPAIHELRVADADDVVPVQLEQRVMGDVAGARRTDVMASVDLYDEAITDQEVDPMPQQPDLGSDGHAQPP